MTKIISLVIIFLIALPTFIIGLSMIANEVENERLEK